MNYLILLSIFTGFYFIKSTNGFYFEIFISNNTSNLKLSANFEMAYLINSYETKKGQLSLMECLSFHSINIFSKAILYQDLDDSKIICNSYSNQPSLNSDTALSQSIKSRIYLIKKNATSKVFF